MSLDDFGNRFVGFGFGFGFVCINVGICLCLLCWNLRLLCFGVIKLIKMGNTPSIPKESPLGHILDNWVKHSREPMTKKDIYTIVIGCGPNIC